MLSVTAQLMDGFPNNDSAYQVEVRVNGSVIWRGIVYGHDRSKGWAQLLRDIAAEKDRE